MTECPKVSVIMGIYNCEKTLPEAIESILRQTYPNWELILCDDGSSDGTYAIADSYAKRDPQRIVLIRNETNKKLAYTLNRCLSVASGELIARMDGDDISHPDRFLRQTEYLLAHPDIQLVGTDMRCFDETGTYGIRHAAEHPDKLTLKTRSPFFHATVMTYKSVYDALGGYSVSERAERAEDLELWFRFFHAGFRGENIPEALYNVRENRETLLRRTAKDRMNVVRLKAQGFRLLGFPKRWIVKPAVTAVLKSCTPMFAVRFLHRRRGFGGS